MKKSLLALAVLGAFAGAASAQSSVTIGGFVDASVGKAIGTKDKTMLDSGGSRLYFKGQEDLGGGTAAIFNIEHRFNPYDGNSNSSTFWNGRSTVGLTGGFGTVELGRDYSVAFLMIQNQIDPFGGDTVANLRDTGMRVGGITKVRFNSQVEYHFSAAGFNFGANVGGANENGGTKKPYAVALNYAAGPVFVGAGIENPAGANDNQWNVGARYNFGIGTVSAGYAAGKNNASVKYKGALIGATFALGAGDLKLGYAKQNQYVGNKVGIGYHYNLSKRTKLYADFARKSVVPAGFSKTGYDLGIRHNF